MIFVKINQYEVFTKKYPWRLKVDKPSSFIAQLPHMHAVRSLRTNQVRTKLGRYVATEPEPKLGHYVATECPSRLVAT